MKALLMGLMVVISMGALAKKEGGNGGDSFVCYDRHYYKTRAVYVDQGGVLVPKQVQEVDPDAKIISASLKDYWEYRLVGYFNIDLGSQSDDYYERARDVILRLHQIDPIRSERLQKRLITFKREFLFTDRAHIPEIDDSNSVVIPREGTFCYERQLAVQKIYHKFGERKILVDMVIFNLLSIDDQAGLVLHELLYEDAIYFQDWDLENSDSVRYFNYLISSEFMMSKDVLKDYSKVIIQEGMTPHTDSTL